MGMEEVRVAILSAMETVTAKVPSTIEAAALCKMAERGQITRALLDGPLALDNAISPAAAAIKKITSPDAGRANVLVVPDLEAGNMLAKSLSGASRCRWNCARSTGSNHPDQPRRFVTDASRIVRRRGHGRRSTPPVGLWVHSLRRDFHEGWQNQASSCWTEGTHCRRGQRPVDRVWMCQGIPHCGRISCHYLAE